MIPPVIPPLFSKKFLDEFTRDHPIQAWLVIAFGLGMTSWVIWLICSK